MDFKVKIDLDPTINRVIAIAICLFAVTFFEGLVLISLAGEMPNLPQIVTIVSFGMLAGVTYLLTFLQKEEEGPPLQKEEEGPPNE